MTGKHWITISGPARVSSLAEKPIDRATLARFDGVVDDSVQDLAEYVDEQELVRVGVHGGAIALRFDDTSGVLFVESTYAVDVPLSDALALRLADFTLGQWSDGMGTSDDIMSGLPYRAAPGEGLVLSVWEHENSTAYFATSSWWTGRRRISSILEGGKRPTKFMAT